jgi:DNA topoisomerase-2
MATPSEELSFEWLGPAEAVLRRPDMYVGSVEAREEHELLFPDAAGDAVEPTDWTLSPIFRKVFDEVFVNALDAAARDDTVRKISVTYDDDGTIVVENDGRGIPIKHFKDTGRYIPEVVFSELNAGSNFEDVGRRLGGGRNGVGVVCANVWSTSFSVEVHDGENQASYAQTFTGNMRERTQPVVGQRTGRRRGSVTVRFVPDYARLGVDFGQQAKLLRTLVGTRCREGAVCVRAGVAVHYCGAKLPESLVAYTAALLGTPTSDLAKDEAGSPGGPHLQAAFGRRGEGGTTENVAFVNGVRCCQGTHVRHVLDRVSRTAQGKAPRDLHVRPQTVRDVVGFVAVCRIPDPAFSGQAKEALTTPPRSFGFVYEELAPKVVNKLQKQGVFEEIFRRETERDIASTVRKTQVPKSKEVLVDKYDPALLCRTDPQSCTLILTEGDSAKALVVAGLSVVGREHYGVFPLRGVPLNVRNVPVKKCLENKEIANVLRILNIAPGRSAEGLRYGRLAIMSDQDLDGSHIAALIVNFVHCLVPGLLEARPDFLCRIVTPLLRATHGRTGEVLSFFSQQELDAWLEGPDRAHYRLKYYKGLGTNSALEAKEIFSQLERHTVTLTPTEGMEAAVLKFFDEGRVAERKEMLTDSYDPKLCVDYSQAAVPIDAFLEREVVHFSQYHVRRALASAVDGLTPARRKVLFYFLSLPAGRELRVAQAAAGVSQKTCYHHGENSLVECIVGSAQDHVGTNNVALLEPLGQFGSRHDKPSTHASQRRTTRSSSMRWRRT